MVSIFSWIILAGGTCTVPRKHRVVRRLLFLLVLLTHIEGGQIHTQELSDAFPAVDVSVLIQNLGANLKLPPNLLRRGGPEHQRQPTFVFTNLSQ